MFSYIKRFFSTNISFLIILVIVVFSLYGKAINYELLNLDDKATITDNISYISNVKNIPKFFLQSCYYTNYDSYYRPILSLSFAIETILFGYNTKAYHTTNIILFILVFYLMFLLLSKINLNKNISKFILLLFSVHPIFVSNVVYVSPRAESILTICIILFFINFINYIKTTEKIYKIFYYLLFVLTLFTKETGIMLFPIYFLFIYCFNIKITKKQLISDLIFFVFITIFYLFLRSIAVPKILLFDFINNYKIILNNTFNELLVYTEKIIVPDYIPTMLYKTKITLKVLIINLLVLIPLIFIYIKKIISRKMIVFGIFWYLIFIFPTFLIFEHQILFHRLLLPLFGIIIILILLTDKLLIKYKEITKYIIIITIGFFLILFYSSYMQKDKYKSNKIFTVNSYLDSHNRISDFAFIDILTNTGNFEKAKSLILEKMKERTTYREILVLAKLYLASGHFEEAEYAYLQLEKDLPIQKDLIFVPLSEIYYIKEDYEKSFSYIKKAYELKPYDTNILKQLAKINEKIGNTKEALEIYKNLSKIDKSNKEYKDKINLLEKIKID